MYRPKTLLLILIKGILLATLLSLIILVSRNTSNSSSSEQILQQTTDRSHMVVTLRKSNNPFRCYSDVESTLVKEFYQLDCENPFLKIISLRDMEAGADVCEIFNESYDGNDNHTLYSRIKREFKHFRNNITHNDTKEIEAACPDCHLIQIIDGQLYVVEYPTTRNSQTNTRSLKILLNQVTDTFRTIGDLEMFINTKDVVNLKSAKLNTMKHNVPVFGFSKTRHRPTRGLLPDSIILIPCFSFWVYTAPNFGRWRSTFETLPKIADKIKWKNRIGKVMWRGAKNGDRLWLTGIGEGKNDSMFDIEFIDWKPGKLNPHYSHNFKTIEQTCEYKYLLHQEGWSYSNRLKYLLLCQSPVIYANFYEWEEYWYHLLKDDYNILVFKDKGNENAFKNLSRAIINDEEKAKFIGKNGRALVQKYLSEQAVVCYFRNILIEYAKLFNYKPVKHPKAVKIDEYMIGYSP